ncbi:hypothetical protein [Microbulbifer sp. PSTR4-B]|uniref:hypothetical protein n=1 Tax=unclassified Microbulbifer TaxID=2619833 RepID=UPI00403A8FAF
MAKPTVKPFRITNEIRSDIAMALTSEAVEKSIKSIAKEAEQLNKNFWKLYEKRLRAVSGIPSTRWSKLIQEGFATSCYSIVPKIRVNNASSVLLQIDRDSQAFRQVHCMLNRSLQELLDKWIKPAPSYSRYATLFFTAPRTLPGLNDGSILEDPELIAAIRALKDRIITVLSEALSFLRKTQTVLNSCRSSKQLEELLPVAAKYLPRREEKTQELAPIELASSVTEMLQQGIPTSKASAA